MARRIPLPRLTRRQRLARWQRERRQQALYVAVFSAILFFVVGLVAWAASDKYYQDNLKPAMRFDGRVIPMRDWKTELKYEQTRFYVEFGVPAGYENDPQIAQQKAQYERGALDTIEEYAILDAQAASEGTSAAQDAIDARYEADFSQFRSRHILILINKDATDQTLEANNALAKATAIRDQLRQNPNDQNLWNQLAKDNSEDPGSKDSGGELGWVGKGQFVKAFEDAANALPIGAISDPVKSDFAEVAKKYSEDSATKDKGGDIGWLARGMLTDLGAENELFNLDAGARSQQHNGLAATIWYKVIEKSASRDLEDDQKTKIKDSAYKYWLSQQKKAHDVLRLIPGLEFE